MAIDLDILAEAGTTNDKLREFFRTKEEDLGTEDTPQKRQVEQVLKRQKKIKDLIGSRLSEHISFALRNHHLYSSVDLAWDSSPINKHIIPLILYAQKRINLVDCASSLESAGNRSAYVKRDKSGKIMDIDLPKFFEVNINLIRSLITRRLAAQSNKYSNLWPFFKYEPRTTGQVGKLKADVLSQRMDVMADQYGYRHFQTQVMRDMFLYGHSVAFPRAAWERDVQWEKKSTAKEFTKPLVSNNGKKVPIPKRTRVVREGVSWVNPHPSRVFWDNAYPLPSINSDTGCEYIGFWDVVRYGDILDNPNYFNRDKVGFSSVSLNYFSQYAPYFNQYYSVITPPDPYRDLSGRNDSKNNVGKYSGEMREQSVFVADYFWKMVPSEWGIGSYPYPVWVHLKIAGDNTIVFAELMPSSPAAAFSYNESDSRLVNISVAHELMSFQDQLTNLFSQLLETAKADLFSMAVLNTDVFPDTDEGKQVLEDFRATMQGKNFYATTHVLEASFRRLAELGVDTKADNIFKVVRSQPNSNLVAIFNSITQLISMAERMMALSPQEQGQPAPREISATEVNVISGTTESVYSFISDAVDEGRSSMKKICYESLICCGSDTVLLPVVNRYPRNIVEMAGFTVMDDEQDDQVEVNRHTVMGKKVSLIHDYAFNTRDGAERTSDIQSANTLVNLMQTVIAQPMVAESLDKRQLFMLLNEIIRLTGTGVNIKLEIPEGPAGDETLSQGPSPEQLQQIMQQVQQNSQAIEQVLATAQGLPPQGMPQGMPQGPPQGMPQGPPPNVPAGAMPV